MRRADQPIERSTLSFGLRLELGTRGQRTRAPPRQMGYDDPATDAYYDRKLAKKIKWQAEQASRKGYDLVAKELWDAYHALLKEAKLEEAKAKK